VKEGAEHDLKAFQGSHQSAEGSGIKARPHRNPAAARQYHFHARWRRGLFGGRSRHVNLYRHKPHAGSWPALRQALPLEVVAQGAQRQPVPTAKLTGAQPTGLEDTSAGFMKLSFRNWCVGT
jgi:hypothetical protein